LSQRERAYEAWPGQWVYAYGLASLAAAARDTAQVVRGLAALADLGAGPELERDTTLARYATAAVVAPVWARIEANRSPLVKSRALSTRLPDDFYPEGVSHDPRTGRFYVASIRHRSIAVVEPDGSARDFVRPGQDGFLAGLGVRVDAERGLVWATCAALPQMEGYAAADSGRGAIYAFELASGRLRVRHELPAASGGHVPGDLAVAPNGDVYLTDSLEPVIYRLCGERGALETWATHEEFRSLQGLALTTDENVLVVADYSHGLYFVSSPAGSTRPRVIPIRPPAGMTLLGIDGIARLGRDLIAVQNGLVPPRVIRIRGAADGPNASAVEVLDRHLPTADEPTIGTIVGNEFVYVANSQWEKYDEAGRLKERVRLTPPVLLRLPLAP
jgi:hypothetical protein